MNRADAEQILELLRSGIQPTTACYEVGLSVRALQEAIHADPTFGEEVEAAITMSIEAIEHSMYVNARVNGDTEAQKFLLKNLMPRKYADTTRIEHTGRGGGAIQVATQVIGSMREMLEVEGGEATASVLTRISRGEIGRGDVEDAVIVDEE